jgi:hypothetical protein
VGRTCHTHGRDEDFTQGFGRKPDGKRPLGRPSYMHGGGISK